ncbi:hypothetical protein NFA99_004599 [Escherichia coli]|nr:hypothetical protein [Escherichia coli]
MTTIAFDLKTLAADSLVTYDGMRVGNSEKIAKVIGGTLGSAGNLEDVTAAKAWFNAGCPEKRPVLTSYIGIFIPDDGSSPQEYNEKLIQMALPSNSPWVAGTGKNFAMAAMLAGKGAAEAVEIAIKLDIYSGGPVRVYCPPAAAMGDSRPYGEDHSLNLGAFPGSALLPAE